MQADQNTFLKQEHKNSGQLLQSWEEIENNVK